MMDKKILELLKDRNLRREQKLILVSTEKTLAEASAHGADTVYFLFSGDKSSIGEKYGINVRTFVKVKESYIDKHASVKSHQGFIALMSYEPKPVEADNKKYVILDSIQDPANLGAIIRTGSAFGFRAFLLYNCAYIFNEKAIRASAGAVFMAQISSVDAEGLKNIKKERKIFITSGKEGGAPEQVLNEDRYAITFSNEGHGVSEELEKIAGGKVRIAVKSGVESLNVAASAAILFYVLRDR